MAFPLAETLVAHWAVGSAESLVVMTAEMWVRCLVDWKADSSESLRVGQTAVWTAVLMVASMAAQLAVHWAESSVVRWVANLVVD